LFIEYFMRESGVKMFDDVIANPIHPEDGYLAPRTGAGFGIVLQQAKLDQYRIA
jgi:D-arabinonate dehydratase